MRKKTGIYLIKCLVNKYEYVGSALNIKERWGRHKKDLKKGKHHSIILQRAYDKYGIENFDFSIIEECEVDLLYDREQYYINEIEPIFNICRNARSRLGVKDSEKTKKLKREASLRNGNKPPLEYAISKRKKVQALNDNKEIVKTFESLSEACLFINRNHKFVSCITRASKLGVKSYGYYWKII